MDFEQIACDRCGKLSSAYYTLSSLTKGMYVRCETCGNHAAPYVPGRKIAQKPSKAFMREVGKEEALRRAREMEQGVGEAPFTLPPKKTKATLKKIKVISPEVISIPLDKPIFYCDAGTKNNGQFGNQKTVVVVTNAAGEVIVEEWVGDKTNNEGELIAIIRAAGKAPHGAAILSDSQLAVKWVEGKFGTKIERLKPLIYDAMTAVNAKEIQMQWIPRDMNLAGHYIEATHSL